MRISIYESYCFAKFYPLYSGRIFHSEKNEYQNIEYSLDIPEDDLVVVNSETGEITIFEGGMKNKELLKQYVYNNNFNIL